MSSNLLKNGLCVNRSKKSSITLSRCIKSRGRPDDRPDVVPIRSSMQRQGLSPTDVLRTCSTAVLRTLKYDVLRTSQCNVLGTFPCCPICNAIGRRLPTYWERFPQTIWECSHYGLIFTPKGRVLPMSCRRLSGLEDVPICFYK